MKTQLALDKIAKALGAERGGKISVTGGYFGAMQLLADIEVRFHVPAGGGRPTDPRWTEGVSSHSPLEPSSAWRRSRQRSGSATA